MNNALPSTPTGRKSYKSLKHLIRNQVLRGDFAAHERLPSIRGLTEIHSMSLATVQRALSELCDEGVLYSQKGRGTFVAPLRKDLTNVGVLSGMSLENLSNSIFQPLLNTFQAAALKGSKSVTLFQVRKRHKGQYNYVDEEDIIRHDLDALVLINVLDLGLIASLKHLGMPLLATDLDTVDIGVHSISFDNEASAFDLTNRLMDDGHERIWFIGGVSPGHEEYDLCRRQRFTGYRLACRNRIGVGPEFHQSHQNRSIRDQLLAAMTDQQPTAIVTEQPGTMLDILGEIGRPDIKVAGWSPLAAREDLLPRITYLATCDFAQLGKQSFSFLASLYGNERSALERSVLELPIWKGQG